MKIAVLSDTHNLLRQEVKEHLKNCDYILHGGDISREDILNQLKEFAPVRVVRGNNDKEWADHLPSFLDIELGGLRIYITHKKKDLPKDLTPYDIVIVGHSHQYKEEWIDHGDGRKTLLLNPGSCGPRRFHQAITMALLTIVKEGWTIERIEILHDIKRKIPDNADLKTVIELVTTETEKGRSPADIAEKNKLDSSVVETIVRLYLTHPGVTADGIMTKMGL